MSGCSLVYSSPQRCASGYRANAPDSARLWLPDPTVAAGIVAVGCAAADAVAGTVDATDADLVATGSLLQAPGLSAARVTVTPGYDTNTRRITAIRLARVANCRLTIK